MRGVSLLLEIIVGLGVFSTALLFVFSIFPLAQRSAIQARNVSIATSLARDRLEQLKNLGFSAPDTACSFGSPLVQNPDPLQPGTVNVMVNGVSSPLSFTRVYGVTMLTAGNDLKAVTVNVSWTESSLVHTVEMEGYIGKF